MPQGLLDFLNKNPTLVTFLFGSGVIISFFKFLYEQYRKRNLPTDSNAFEVLDDPDTFLKDIFFNNKKDNDVFADHKLNYIPRLSENNIHEKLKTSLRTNKYVLVKGKSGIGKTREAAEVALDLMKSEKYVVVRICKGWLDVPRNGLKSLKNSKFILLFLDDLNDLFGSGSADLPPDDKNISLLGSLSFHNRLLRTIDWFSKTTSYLFVLATASDEPDNWAKIDFNPKDPLWSKFTTFPMPGPSVSAQQFFLENEANRGDIPTTTDECIRMANANDGTFRNLANNLRNALYKKISLTSENFFPAQNMTWEARYRELIESNPNTKYLYKSIYLLKQAGIDLDITVVNKFAIRLTTDLSKTDLYKHTKFLEWVEHSENWLRPAVGLIEAAHFTEKWDEYIFDIQKVLTDWLSTKPNQAKASIFRFTSKLIEKEYLDEAKILMTSATKCFPDDDIPYTALAIIFEKLENNAESKANLEKAKKLQQEAASKIAEESRKSQETRNDWSNTSANYYGASLIYPANATIHELEGILLKALGKSKEAEDKFGISIKYNPLSSSAHYNLALLLKGLDRLEEAIPLFQKSIELDTNNVEAYRLLGQIFRDKNDLKTAEQYFDKRLKLLPEDDIESKIDYASINKELGNPDVAIEFAGLALKNINSWGNDPYSRARVYSIMGNNDDAIKELKLAALDPDFETARARNNPDFKWLREDARFSNIVDPQELT